MRTLDTAFYPDPHSPRAALALLALRAHALDHPLNAVDAFAQVQRTLPPSSQGSWSVQCFDVLSESHNLQRQRVKVAACCVLVTVDQKGRTHAARDDLATSM